MAVTVEMMNNNDMRKALQEMCGRERSLVAELEKVREARRVQVAMMMKQADQMRNEAEQYGLALDYEAGDKSVILDAAAGNGAGSYRREVNTIKTRAMTAEFAIAQQTANIEAKLKANGAINTNY